MYALFTFHILINIMYSTYTDYFSIYANLCAPKSRKSTCPGFDLVTPLHLNLTPNNQLIFS